MAVRRGQFFLLGALILASLLLGILLLGDATLSAPPTSSPRILHEQAMDTFPAAVNAMLVENASMYHLQQQMTAYLGAEDSAFASHSLESRQHAIVTLPNATGVTVVVANFRASTARDLVVQLDGVTRSRQQLGNDQTVVFFFPGVSTDSTVTVSFSADRSVSTSFTAHIERVTAQYSLLAIADDQRWAATRTY